MNDRQRKAIQSRIDQLNDWVTYGQEALDATEREAQTLRDRLEDYQVEINLLKAGLE